MDSIELRTYRTHPAEVFRSATNEMRCLFVHPHRRDALTFALPSVGQVHNGEDTYFCAVTGRKPIYWTGTEWGCGKDHIKQFPEIAKMGHPAVEPFIRHLPHVERGTSLPVEGTAIPVQCIDFFIGGVTGQIAQAANQAASTIPLTHPSPVVVNLGNRGRYVFLDPKRAIPAFGEDYALKATQPIFNEVLHHPGIRFGAFSATVDVLEALAAGKVPELK